MIVYRAYNHHTGEVFEAGAFSRRRAKKRCEHAVEDFWKYDYGKSKMFRKTYRNRELHVYSMDGDNLYGNYETN